MLNGEGDQDQDRADEEGRVEPKPEAFLHEAEVEELDLPGADRGFGWEERIQDIARGDTAADGKHRRPGEPIAPHRERRDEFRVAHPGGCAIDRCSARLVGKETGNLRVGKGLEKAEDDGQGPDKHRGCTHGRGNAADGEEDESGDAARDPESILPTDDAMKLGRRRDCIGSFCGSNHGHPSFWSSARCLRSSRARMSLL